MERKRIICRIFVLTLLAVAALSLCAFADADPPYYFDYKIKGNDVYLRSAPATANQYNVIGILQNNEPIMVWEWVGIWPYGSWLLCGNDRVCPINVPHS